MPKFSYEHGSSSVMLTVFIQDSSETDGSGKTGLAFGDTGLIISTRADVEATPVTYTSAASTIEGITTLGTYAAPTATKCRFKEVDATNQPGYYEIHLADARYAVSGAASINVAIHGVANAAQTNFEIQLSPVPANVTEWRGAIPNALVSARVDSLVGSMGASVLTSSAIANNAITAAKIGTAALTSAKISVNFIEAIRDGILDDATRFSGADIAAMLADTADMQPKLGTAEEIADAVWDELRSAHLTAGSFGEGIASVQGNITGSVASVTGAVASVTGAVGSLGATAKADVNAEVDAAIETYGLDHLLSTSVIGADIANNSIFARLASSAATADWDSYDNTTDSLEALRDRGDAAWTAGSGTGLTPLASGTAQAGAAGSITLAAGESATTDFFQHTRILTTGGTGVGQSRYCTAYNGSTKVATVDENWLVTPDVTTTYEIQACEANLTAISRDNAAANNLELDYDGGGYAKVNSTIGTCTTNTDMVGTNSALLAANVPTNFSDLAITSSTGRVSVGTSFDKTGYSISGTKTTLDALNDLTAAAINAEVDTALSDINLDKLLKNTATLATDVTAASVIDQMFDDGTAIYDRTTDSLQAIRDRGDTSWLTGGGTGLSALATGTAQAGTASTITLAAGESATTNFFKDTRIVLTGGTGVGQSGYCSAYDGTTKAATVKPDWRVTPDGTTTYEIQACDAVVEGLPADIIDLIYDEIMEDSATSATKTNNFTARDIMKLGLAAWAGRTQDSGATFMTPDNTQQRMLADVVGNERVAMTLKL